LVVNFDNLSKKKKGKDDADEEKYRQPAKNSGAEDAPKGDFHKMLENTNHLLLSYYKSTNEKS